jgi:hypothetical protein|nr:MAG TPA: hypothetical protein [Caudoviricetes sp.]
MSDRIEAEILDVFGEEVNAAVDTSLVVIEGTKGDPGADGVTPHIGDNGNWYLGENDTGKPSRGATGSPGKNGDKGDPGAPGQDGHSPVVTATKSGKTTTISVDGAAIATVEDGADGKPGAAGAPGKDGAGMDITGATAGQIAKITAVDASGVPTAWSPADMPSGGSPDAVLYTPQTLTDEQKKQARENVAAMRGGYANQMYNASDHGLDIYSVAGSGALCNVIADIGNDSSGEPIPSPALMVCAKADRGWISAFLIASNGRVYYSSLNLTDEDAPVWTKESSQIMLNNGGALEQQTMASAPTSDMQIATKRYVDDALDGKAGTAVATTSTNGLMSAADKVKLDGVEAGANKTTVPTALKNPNALTIQIGSTTITYDGSTAQTVTIADGTEVSY